MSTLIGVFKKKSLIIIIVIIHGSAEIKLMQWWEKYFSNSPVLTLSLKWKQI